MKNKTNNDYFISFGSAQGNLGCVAITEQSFKGALFKATELGINPGGEPAIWQIDKTEADRLGRDKLLSPQYMREMGYTSSRDVSPDARRKFLDDAARVCPNCNRDLIQTAESLSALANH